MDQLSSVAVAQLGARMHYAVPRQLQRHGMLHRLYTDATGVTGLSPVARAVPARLRPMALTRLLGRVPHGVPRGKITSFSVFGLQYGRRLAACTDSSERVRVYLWGAEEFGRRILDSGLAGADAVYTFNGAGLEILRSARGLGLHAIMEQSCAPRMIEAELVAEEHQRYPEWERYAGEAGGEIHELNEREHQEWATADTILCGSPFVRDGIAAVGGPVDKCVVVPYGVDLPTTAPAREPRGRDSPLRVLFVGGVRLQKGVAHLAEAARLLGDRAQVRVVGPKFLTAAGEQQIGRYVEVVGPVPRAEVADHLAWADVFVLPSICEGSATVTYEALAAGLPVICTPNSGSIVRDGRDGFIVPIRDAAAIVECLERLRDPVLRAGMSANARERALFGSEGAYGRRLVRAFEPRAAGTAA